MGESKYENKLKRERVGRVLVRVQAPKYRG
jgi:hypothetical protein